MITLSDALKRLRDHYALHRPNDPSEVKRTFSRILRRDFDGAKLEEFILKIRKKGARLIIYVTHPVIIQELEGIAIPLIDAVNRELGENVILDIDFKVVSQETNVDAPNDNP